MKVPQFKVIKREVLGGDGFLQLARHQLTHRADPDAPWCEPYLFDCVLRDKGIDAVCVVPFSRDPAAVLLRQSVRPALELGREPAESSLLVEAVAGIIERDDAPDDEGLRVRAAAELAEELGLKVEADALFRLGPPMYQSPGTLAECIHFFAVETDLSRRARPDGDGSALEELGTVIHTTLVDALARCSDGSYRDLKTECALRRLDGHLR